MGELVNLRTERKRAARRQKEARAAENRLIHGRSKTDRQLDAARNEKAATDFGQHRIDTGDDR
jgi:hypothetical protein